MRWRSSCSSWGGSPPGCCAASPSASSKLIRLDVLAERSGIEDFLIQGGVRSTAVTILASLIYWLVLFAVVLALLNALGLGAAANLLNQIVLYLPHVFVAILVLMFGTLFARLIRGVAFTYLSNVGIEGAMLISILAQYAVLVFVVSLALEQLDVGGRVLVSAFQIAFGGFCLALALAFGLGGREWAARILERTSRAPRGAIYRRARRGRGERRLFSWLIIPALAGCPLTERGKPRTNKSSSSILRGLCASAEDEVLRLSRDLTRLTPP